MSSKKCKHNRQRNKLIAEKKVGTHHVYCTQCQKWVDIRITQDDIDRAMREFREKYPKGR